MFYNVLCMKFSSEPHEQVDPKIYIVNLPRVPFFILSPPILTQFPYLTLHLGHFQQRIEKRRLKIEN